MDLSSSLLVYFGVRFHFFGFILISIYVTMPSSPLRTGRLLFLLSFFFLCLVICLGDYIPPEIVMILSPRHRPFEPLTLTQTALLAASARPLTRVARSRTSEVVRAPASEAGWRRRADDKRACGIDIGCINSFVSFETTSSSAK